VKKSTHEPKGNNISGWKAIAKKKKARRKKEKERNIENSRYKEGFQFF